MTKRDAIDGRGGSSGMASGGGRAIDAKMPELQGSEKQVKWAVEIRSSALQNADYLVKNEKRWRDLGLTEALSNDAVEFVKRDLVNSLESVTKASSIIDARRGLTYDALKRRAKEYDWLKRNGKIK